MKQTLVTFAVAACCAFAGTAGAAMTKEEYKAQNDKIEADYRAANDICKALKANAQDICKAEAKGKEKIAKAQLEASIAPSPRAEEKVRMAKANANYDVAKERCGDLSGNAKDVCKKEAKAAFETAKAEAKVSKM
jgi:membrane-associated HD superfamily phosphohydrolase